MEVTEVVSNEDFTIVRLSGHLDVMGMHEIDAEFHRVAAAQGKHCIVDLSGVEFIASLGVGMLISCAQSLSRNGKKMVLMSPNETVREVLVAVGLDSAIPIVETEDEARPLLASS